MDWLRKWLTQDNTKGDRDYQPLSQAADGPPLSRGPLRHLGDGETGPSYRATAGHLDQTEFIPIHQFGIELHPDTATLLENEDALARAFGGNSQSGCDRPHAQGDQADHHVRAGLKDFFSGRLVLICAFSACLGG